MLELFSRQPDVLPVAKGSHLTPLPMEEDVSSLSAILMDTDYYGLIQAGRRMVDGLPVVGPAQLIALKARAWIDLTERERGGEKIDSKTIKKHKNDVFRLFRILDPTVDIAIPTAIKRDLNDFVVRMRSEDIDLKALGFRSGTCESILTEFTRVYHLG